MSVSSEGGGGYAEALPPARSAPAEAARLRDLGFNVIPIKPGQKMPRAGEGDILRWRDNGCTEEIRENDNIAMLHGGVGGTWAMDCDDPTILQDLLDDYEQNAPKMCVVRTPKQGHHILFRRDPSDMPPGDPKYSDSRGRKIDVKSVGYTLLPPSIHPERRHDRYQYQFATDTPNITMRWSDAVTVLRSRGFFSPQDRDEMFSDLAGAHVGGGAGGSGGGDYVPGSPPKYEYNDLLRGGFGPGERRRKMNSLYVKKRVMGSTREDAEAAVRYVNSTCQPPLSDREMRYNTQASEHFFQAHKDEIDHREHLQRQQAAHVRQQSPAPPAAGGGMPPVVPAAAAGAGAGGSGRRGGRRGANALDMHHCATIIMNETHYVEHPSKELFYYAGGIWIQGGDRRLRKSCEAHWRDRGITMSQIREIEDIVRTRTTIVPDGSKRDVFDRDPTKIVIENGTYDLSRGEMVEHSPAHMSTIRHPITYDPAAECPGFDEALAAWFDGHGPDKYGSIIMDMFALCLLRKNLVQKGYVHFGKGSNGKSTCLDVLREMLGQHNTSSIEMQSFQESRFVGEELYAKSANISSDGGTQPLVNTGLIKAVLSGDSIRCEPKNKKAFVFRPYCTLVFTFNELPPVLDSSDGFARKIQLVPWQNRFDRRDRPGITDLPYDESERSGIFNRIIPRMMGFLAKQPPEYEDDIEATQNMWMKRADSFFMFREEYLVVGRDPKGREYQIEVNQLYSLYQRACGEHGMTPLTRNVFHSKVGELLGSRKAASTRINGENVRVWKGLTDRSLLKPEGQTALDDRPPG